MGVFSHPPRVSRLVIDVTDLDRAAAFWAALLDLDVRARTADRVDLSPLGAGGPMLSFQLVGRSMAARRRARLDLVVDDAAGGVVAAGRRASALGATPVSAVVVADRVSRQVWRDVEGNEFRMRAESVAAPTPAPY